MTRYLCVALLGVLATATASAHGPQLQVTNTGGKIATRNVLVNTYAPLTDEKSVYVAPVTLIEDLDFGPSWRLTATEESAYPFGPGLAYGLDATFPTNSTLTVSFLDELRVWDGGAFVSAGATELGLLATSNPNGASLAGNAGVSASTDPLAEVTIGDSYNENAHSSMTWVLLGDGADPASAVADGVYLASAQVSSSDPSIAASDPFYLVLDKGAAGGLASAVASLGVAPSAVQYLVIPEPASCLLVALACVAAVSRKRS